jgi:hypothetical protein
LCATLVAGKRYAIAVDLAASNEWGGWVSEPVPGRLEVWGGYDNCDAGQLLWTSEEIPLDSVWRKQRIDFVNFEPFSHLMLFPRRAVYDGSNAIIIPCIFIDALRSDPDCL